MKVILTKDVDDVALAAEVLDILGKDDPHDFCLVARYGNRAISRAFLMAVATWR